MEFDPARVLRASRLRIGPVRAMGVPSILIGVAGIILAAGFSRSMGTIAPMLPETLRELKTLIDAGRDTRTLKA
jgi:predicted membrane protein